MSDNCDVCNNKFTKQKFSDHKPLKKSLQSQAKNTFGTIENRKENLQAVINAYPTSVVMVIIDGIDGKEGKKSLLFKKGLNPNTICSCVLRIVWRALEKESNFSYRSGTYNNYTGFNTMMATIEAGGTGKEYLEQQENIVEELKEQLSGELAPLVEELNAITEDDSMKDAKNIAHKEKKIHDVKQKLDDAAAVICEQEGCSVSVGQSVSAALVARAVNSRGGVVSLNDIGLSGAMIAIAKKAKQDYGNMDAEMINEHVGVISSVIRTTSYNGDKDISGFITPFVSVIIESERQQGCQSSGTYGGNSKVTTEYRCDMILQDIDPLQWISFIAITIALKIGKLWELNATMNAKHTVEKIACLLNAVTSLTGVVRIGGDPNEELLPIALKMLQLVGISKGDFMNNIFKDMGKSGSWIRWVQLTDSELTAIHDLDNLLFMNGLGKQDKDTSEEQWVRSSGMVLDLEAAICGAAALRKNKLSTWKSARWASLVKQKRIDPKNFGDINFLFPGRTAFVPGVLIPKKECLRLTMHEANVHSWSLTNAVKTLLIAPAAARAAAEDAED